MKIIFLLLLISTISIAQDRFQIGFGVNSDFPTGDFKKFSKNEIGCTFHSIYEITDVLISSVSVSKTNFYTDINAYNILSQKVKRQISMASIMLGLQYKITSQIAMTFDGGMNYINLPKEYYLHYNQIILSNSKTEAYYILSWGLRYELSLSNTLQLSSYFKYSLVNGQFSNFNHFTVGAILLADLDL